jgi:hypothetical protein
MSLITRTAKGSKLTIAEMDGNLEYLQTNLSGSNTIIGNTTIKTSTDSDVVLEIFTTSSVVTESFFGGGGDSTTTTQIEAIRSSLSAIFESNTAAGNAFLGQAYDEGLAFKGPISGGEVGEGELESESPAYEFTSSFSHINTSTITEGVLSGTFGELGISYTFASSSYDADAGDFPSIGKFIGGDTGFYGDQTTISLPDQNGIFQFNITSGGSGVNPSGNIFAAAASVGSIVLKKSDGSELQGLQGGSSTTLYLDGNQPGVNIHSTDAQVLNVYGAGDPMAFASPLPTLFQVNQSGSISIPQTASAEPAWTGSDGEIVPATVGGVYYLYMWMNGAWRSGSFS